MHKGHHCTARFCHNGNFCHAIFGEERVLMAVAKKSHSCRVLQIQQQTNASLIVYSLEDKIPVHSCSSLANKHDLDFFS